MSFTVLPAHRERIDKLATLWETSRNAAVRHILDLGLEAAEREEVKKRKPK